MKKILTLLAVAMLPATLSGCAACSPSMSLCPCCPCGWFNRAPACPPAPAYCPPATTYATPVAASACGPVCPPMASQMMPQYIMPNSMPMAASGPGMYNPGMVPPQQMMYQSQPAYYGEAGCGCSMMMEPGCGSPSMVSYGPMDGGNCNSGCCEGGSMSPPPAENFVEPRPGE